MKHKDLDDTDMFIYILFDYTKVKGTIAKAAQCNEKFIIDY